MKSFEERARANHHRVAKLARQLGRDHARRGVYQPKDVFRVVREAYREGFIEAGGRLPVEVDGAGRRGTEEIPSTVGSVGENRNAGVEPAAAAVDLLPTDAALRRGVAGRVTAGSSAAPAGVSL